jgi:outer membrane protein OmpA-like peptidoglycan-associated protein
MPLDQTMKNIILGVACVYALAGCVNTEVRDSLEIQDPTVLQTGVSTQQSVEAGAAVPQWTDVYGQIDNPRETIAVLQGRLDQLDERKDSYFGYKDQCWINVAKSERDAGNRWGFVEEAIGEAARLTAGLEGAQPLSADNPSLRTVALLRPDLAEGLRNLRADPRFLHCPPAQQQIACAEVKLMHAGHNAWARQFDAAKVKADAVQSTLAEAQESLGSCAVPEDGAAPLPKTVALPADALFAFKGSTIESLTPEGRQALDSVIADIKDDGDIARITVAGYTDRLGNDAYNRRLSQQRAETVQRYLLAGGVTAGVQAQGYGRASPGTNCRMRDWRTLVACLSNDRRVELRFLRKEDISG